MIHPFSIAAQVFPAGLTDQLYCEFVYYRTLRSISVTSSTLELGGAVVSVGCTASVPRQFAPLRLIAARIPYFDLSLFDNTWRLMGYLDTLECGHQAYVCRDPATNLPESQQKRHRCQECLKAQALPPKKLPHSVPAKKGAVA